MTGRIGRTLLAGTSAVIIAALIAPTAVIAQAIVQQFNIPAQDLGAALRAFGQASGRQIMFSGRDVAGLRSNALVGGFGAEDALQRLIHGTGLRVSRSRDGVLVVRGGSPAGEIEAGGAAANSGSAEEQEIVVTGTNISGAPPIGSRVLVAQASNVDDSGYATVQDYLETLPQNFAGNQTEVQGAAGNFSRGTAINLRGLGAGTTLTLVNGQRQPASGDNGDFVDISAIPTSAIRRIEVLLDGASAIYGADAVGGVVNIILRDDYRGFQSRLRFATAGGDSNEILAAQSAGTAWSSGNILIGYQFYLREALSVEDRAFSRSSDQRPRGGLDFRSNQTNPGNILVGTTIFPVPAGQNGVGLRPQDLVAGTANLGDISEGADLLPRNETHSLFAAGRQRLGSWLEMFANGRYAHRDFSSKTAATTTILTVPSTNAYYVNPTGATTPVRVAYSFLDDLGNGRFIGSVETWAGTAGLRGDLGGGWRVTLAGSYGEEATHSETRNLTNAAALQAALVSSNPATAFNPFGDGSNTSPTVLEAIRRTQIIDSSAGIWSVNALAQGPLFSLPAGTLRLAVGADRRREWLDNSVTTSDIARTVTALFGELAIPILGDAENETPIVEASVAGRYERYSDFGETFNPKLGVNIAPFAGLRIRGTWGTSFRAPRLVDLSPVINPQRAAILPVIDPTSSTGQSIAIFRLGGNPDLQEERATTWTAGLDLQPVSNLTISASYYAIDFRDRVARGGPQNITDILREEAIWREIITRSPSAAALAEVCALLASGSCTATPPAVLVDAGLRNLVEFRTSGVDLGVDAHFDGEFDSLVLGLNANFVFDFTQRVTETSPRIDRTDTIGNPVDFRARATGSWTRGPFTINAAANYTDGYDDRTSAPQRRVASWTTIDLGFVYRIPAGNGLLGNVELSLRATNLFDTAPPFVNTASGFDAFNATPLGRLVALELRKTW